MLALAALLSLPAFGQELTVFAASSLQNAFEEVGRLYRQATGGSVRFSFAASSALARQIEQGAPAALFVSADEQWMDYLAERGLIVPGTRKPLLGNQLVLVVPADRSVTLELKPGFDMRGLLGPDGRWVTGDPAGVPVGRYARDALTSLGVWDFAQTRLVRAENVRVALLFVERGEVAAGVVYQTDAAIASNVRVVGVFPANTHAPISYPVAVVAGRDGADARRFLRFLDSTDARAAFGRHGFSVR
jgi:molybdate transport system substrate-binding protein